MTPGLQLSVCWRAPASTRPQLSTSVCDPFPPNLPPSSAGKLYTVFSAPQYPQFGALQHRNMGAVAVLTPPRWDEPRFVQFGAAPRPQVCRLRGVVAWGVDSLGMCRGRHCLLAF